MLYPYIHPEKDLELCNRATAVPLSSPSGLSAELFAGEVPVPTKLSVCFWSVQLNVSMQLGGSGVTTQDTGERGTSISFTICGYGRHM